jgi:putative ABC transport system permease protein
MKQRRNLPPRIGAWFIRHTALYDDNIGIVGDFDEEFQEIARARGRLAARLWYWGHLLRSLPIFIKDIIYWRIIMIKNYLKVAMRTLRKHKGYSFINISGLAIGMAVCILILLWVQSELSFDRYHENADRIHRLILDAEVGGGSLHTAAIMAPAAPAIVQDYPEVISAARLRGPRRQSVQYQNKLFQERLVGIADNSLFRIFSFNFLAGDPQTALEAPYTVVITAAMAQKYFGFNDPLGQVLKIGGEKEYTVTGVVAEMPANSHLRFNMLQSFVTVLNEEPQLKENWFDIRFFTYLLLAENAEPDQFESKLAALVDKHLGEQLKAMQGTLTLSLQPLTRIHLYSDLERDLSSSGNIAYLYLFSGVALFVLLIAGINFVNLSTARSSSRVQEVGMRKTLGAVRGGLVSQFLGESMLYSLLSLFLALGLVSLILPAFRSLVGRDLSLNFLDAPWLALALLGAALLNGLLAGAYPAFFLSSFHPVRVLKGTFRTGRSNRNFRRVLVVTQFAISIALIIGTLMVYQQIRFMKTKQLGFDKEHVVVIPGLNESMRGSYASIRSELLAVPGVVNVGASSYVPGRGHLVGGFFPEGYSDGQSLTMDYLEVDFDYLPTMGIELLAGRNFSAEFATDADESLIINETAAKKIGWQDPVGKNFIFRPPPGQEGEATKVRVIGVVKDFHMASLRQKIEPTIIFCDIPNVNVFSVRTAEGGDVLQTMKRLEKKWKELAPNRPFDYLFLDESFDSQYRAEERVQTITLSFSILAVFIGCLGLFGMASFTAEQRTKEIGIRKVLGASVHGIVRLLSREYVLLVVMANGIAWPAAYLFLNRWLANFAYRIEIEWGIFVAAGVLALLIALLTVSFQALKAALADPIESLHYE